MSGQVAVGLAIAFLIVFALVAPLPAYLAEQRARARRSSFDAHAEQALRMLGARR